MPPAFADLMAENAEQAVTLFEGEHKTPDLIWNEESRTTASRYIQRAARDLASQQRWVLLMITPVFIHYRHAAQTVG